MSLRGFNLGVVGNGVVGGATARAFAEHVGEVRIHDANHLRSTHTLAQVLACDVVMVCLPTPQSKVGMACDTSCVEHFFDTISGHDGAVVLRSTVPVGFTRRMADKCKNLVHSPEFLTARCADLNAQVPSRNIVGHPRHAMYMAGKIGSVHHPVHDLYTLRWPHVRCLTLSSDETEMIKLGTNGFFGVKVAFFNELRAFCDATGCDWGSVVQTILLDGRINDSHTQVPGPDGKLGFGGACLPKDLASLISQASHLADDKPGSGLFPWVSLGAHQRNAVDRERCVGGQNRSI